jgi:DNA-3-methyladenine glycosylase II
MKPEYWDRATRALARRDAKLRGLIRQYPGIHLARRNDPFTTLARAIVGQQISVKAADSVWNRLHAAVPRFNARQLAACEPDHLRACGLSGQKAGYLLDLAAHFQSRQLRPSRWQELDDEAIIAELTAVKGIGRWTAEMFLIFHELRPDVLPLADLGLRRAVSLLYNDGAVLTPAAIRELAEGWQPWRSVATWYLWRSLDPIPVEY